MCPPPTPRNQTQRVSVINGVIRTCQEQIFFQLGRCWLVPLRLRPVILLPSRSSLSRRRRDTLFTTNEIDLSWALPTRLKTGDVSSITAASPEGDHGIWVPMFTTMAFFRLFWARLSRDQTMRSLTLRPVQKDQRTRCSAGTPDRRTPPLSRCGGWLLHRPEHYPGSRNEGPARTLTVEARIVDVLSRDTVTVLARAGAEVCMRLASPAGVAVGRVCGSDWEVPRRG